MKRQANTMGTFFPVILLMIMMTRPGLALPERSFRVVIQNNSATLTLKQSFNHLCGGVYTGGWLPPGEIDPGKSGGVQSESDGFMTGTEAYVKYDVIGPDNSRQGMIYVYWDNPWWGYTHFRWVTAKDDVFPDCDFTPPEGSTFSNSGTVMYKLNFTLYKHGTEGGGNVTSIGDFVNYVGAPTPATLLGLVGIDKNPELDLEFDDAAMAPPESFGTASLGPKSLQLLTEATLPQWLGVWQSGTVSVSIAMAKTGAQLSASIFDPTPPKLSFEETFSPGPGGLFRRTSTLGSEARPDSRAERRPTCGICRGCEEYYRNGCEIADLCFGCIQPISRTLRESPVECTVIQPGQGWSRGSVYRLVDPRRRGSGLS